MYLFQNPYNVPLGYFPVPLRGASSWNNSHLSQKFKLRLEFFVPDVIDMDKRQTEESLDTRQRTEKQPQEREEETHTRCTRRIREAKRTYHVFVNNSHYFYFCKCKEAKYNAVGS